MSLLELTGARDKYSNCWTFNTNGSIENTTVGGIKSNSPPSNYKENHSYLDLSPATINSFVNSLTTKKLTCFPYLLNLAKNSYFFFPIDHLVIHI